MSVTSVSSRPMCEGLLGLLFKIVGRSTDSCTSVCMFINLTYVLYKLFVERGKGYPQNRSSSVSHSPKYIFLREID